MAEEKEQTFDFEQSLKELEALVERLERGDLALEQSLESFEQGIRLTRACQQALTEAEQKVEILLGRNENAGTADFDPDAEHDA